MKLDRLIGILSLLLQRETVTTTALAERFEVSRRTIQRDIDTLCRAGVPLTTTRGAGGGIAIVDGYRIDRTLLTAPEMQAILAGLRSLDSVSGTRRYAQLMDKLSAGTSQLLPGGGPILIDSRPGTRPVCRPRSSASGPRWRPTTPFPSPTFPPKAPASARWSLATWSFIGPPGISGPGAGPGRTTGCSSSPA